MGQLFGQPDGAQDRVALEDPDLVLARLRQQGADAAAVVRHMTHEPSGKDDGPGGAQPAGHREGQVREGTGALGNDAQADGVVLARQVEHDGGQAGPVVTFGLGIEQVEQLPGVLPGARLHQGRGEPMMPPYG